ncbi:MAG: flippase-like domain-containing protein [Saprospiraceae bacterium]|nr:flippase-like domain-containing protein [Saprospiraceae bacterium]
MAIQRKAILQSALSFLVGFAILFWVFRKNGATIQETVADFRSVPVIWLVLTCVAFMFSNLSRAIRWNMLLHPLGYRPKLINSFLAVMIGYLANMGIPRSGELLRPATLSRYEKIPIEQSVGTTVTDRLMDFLSLFLIMAIGFFLKGRLLLDKLLELTSLNDIGNRVIPLVIIGVLGITGIWITIRWISNSTHHLALRMKGMYLGLKDGLISIIRIERPVWFTIHSLLIWILYISMTYFCFKGFAPTAHITWDQTIVIFIFGALGMIVPTPGGMGSYQFMIQTGLLIFGVADTDGLAVANIIWFTISIICNLGFGLLALFLLPILNRSTVGTQRTEHKPT